MNHSKLIDELLNELSYRVGIVDLKNKNHQSIISEILSEWGEYDVKQIIMEFLTNEDDVKQDGTKEKFDGYTHLGAGVYVLDSQVDSDGKAKKDAQKYKSDGKSLTAMSDDEYNDTKKNQGEKGEKAAATTPQNQQGDGNEKSPEDIEKEKGVEKTVGSSSDYAKRSKEREDKVNGVESDTSNDVKTVYGNVGEGDTDVKLNMLKYGFSGYEKSTGKKPAPGSAGSAFNEIASEEGIHMLTDNPNTSEDELARKMYNVYLETQLGKEQSKSSGVGKIPTDIENDKLWSKCVIAARSARTKFDTTQTRVTTLQNNGKFGEVSKISTYYGADESLEAQVEAINNAKMVVLPNGTQVTKEDAIEFVKAGGGGMNPSDTATFVSDKNGNLLIQFHSDKTSTADIQDNSTLAQEGENYKKTVDTIDGLSNLDKQSAKNVIDEYSKKMVDIEENYNNQTVKIATRLSELPIDKQVEIIENDKGTLQKNIDTAIFGKDGKPKKQFKNYLPSDATAESLSIEQKYKAIQKMVAEGNGKTNEIKVITKVGLALQSKDDSIEGIDVKKLISEERAEVVNLQRERLDALNNQGSVDVDGVDVPLGVYMEAEETIRGFHLSLMDYPPKDYKEGNPSSMVGLSLDVNMGGTNVNGEVLRSCLGVKNTTEFKQKFRLKEAEELIKDNEGNVTGKTVFVYAIDTEGKEIQLGKKTYRSKAGATGKTSNTFTYGTDIQKCFKSKSKQ